MSDAASNLIPIGTFIEKDASPPSAFSDDLLALRFAERHAGDLRYVAKWGKWLFWTGTHWQFDDTLRAFDLAREICRQAAACAERRTAANTCQRHDGCGCRETGEGG